MIRKFIILLMIAIVPMLSVSSTAQAGVVPISRPDIEVPCKMSHKDINKAIRRALVDKGWAAINKDKGHVVGRIYVRRHMLSVDITYNTKLVKIRYKNSESLKYRKREGIEYIHGRADGWIRNIVGLINFHLSNFC